MTGRGRVTAVVFDIGGVLLDWDPRHLYRKLFDDPAAMADFLARICTPSWHLAHDLGADIGESCRRLAGAHPDQEKAIMAWHERGEEMVAGQIDETVTVLAELTSAGVRCLALSNMEAPMFVSRLDRFAFLSWFDGHVISGFEGVAKPSARIFEILLERYRLDAGSTIFIDDKAANVAAAADLGMLGLHFSTADRLRRDLRDLGVPVAAVEPGAVPAADI